MGLRNHWMCSGAGALPMITGLRRRLGPILEYKWLRNDLPCFGGVIISSDVPCSLASWAANSFFALSLSNTLLIPSHSCSRTDFTSASWACNKTQQFLMFLPCYIVCWLTFLPLLNCLPSNHRCACILHCILQLPSSECIIVTAHKQCLSPQWVECLFLAVVCSSLPLPLSHSLPSLAEYPRGLGHLWAQSTHSASSCLTSARSLWPSSSAPWDLTFALMSLFLCSCMNKS